MLFSDSSTFRYIVLRTNSLVIQFFKFKLSKVSKLSSVCLELIDGCCVEPIEVQSVEHIENLLVVVVPSQLADPIQQAEQNTRELEVISGYVLRERVATISQVLHVEGKVRANVQKFFDGGEQLRRGEKAIVKAAVQEVAVLCQHFVNRVARRYV